jgi:tRNA U34 5-methylaminomethyl-2-thiouridine-forming methyltransferase MnmC
LTRTGAGRRHTALVLHRPNGASKKTADPEAIIGAAHILAGALEKLPLDDVELILSISSDKDLGALLDALLPQTR